MGKESLSSNHCDDEAVGHHEGAAETPLSAAAHKTGVTAMHGGQN